MNGRRIETEEQYQNSLKWLVEKAEQLEHPLLDKNMRAKLMKRYDFVADQIIGYQQHDTVQESKGQELEQEQTQDELTDWLDDDE